MDSFAKKILAQTNMMAYEAIKDKLLDTISSAYKKKVEDEDNTEDFWTVENLKQVLEKAEIESKAADIKAALGLTAKKAKKATSGKKRGPSAYILFCGDRRAGVKEENEGATPQEITRMLGAEWKSLTDDEKEPYQERAKAAAPAAEDTPPASPKAKVKKAPASPAKAKKAPASPAKAKKAPASPAKAAKAKKAPASPAKKASPKKKRAPSAYIFFCKDKRTEAKEENPEAKSTEITSVLGAMWKALSDEEKEPYQEQAKEAKEKLEAESDAESGAGSPAKAKTAPKMTLAQKVKAAKEAKAKKAKKAKKTPAQIAKEQEELQKQLDQLMEE